ncbi:MAG: DUF2089 domain-containing protein [FCB group bacterium]|nr:DUF2089 domain-containing protein [FCB group bacterium]
MNKRLKQCPVCNSNLEIVEYHCPECDTSIKGKFGIGDLSLLSPAQQEFAKTFLCCSGNIKEVEKALNISYPTVKNKLAEITSVLCIKEQREKDIISLEILDEIEKGNITVEEAVSKLKKRG